MDTINLSEAKAHLSELVERASGGEEIIIAKAGRPLARLMPIESPPRRVGDRPLGIFARQMEMLPGFDDPLPEDILRAFNGEDP